MTATGLTREAAPLLQWLWQNVLPNVLPLLRRVLSANIHTRATIARIRQTAEVGATVERNAHWSWGKYRIRTNSLCTRR
jgi:hypothetical protein